MAEAEAGRRGRWARTVHTVLTTPYPYAAQHIAYSPDDVDVTPARLHPAFHGSFDWHSSLHMQWSAVTLVGRGVDEGLADLLDQRLTPEHVLAEAAYLRERPSFERPYGWAWAARLAATCRGTAWEAATALLLDVVGDLFTTWLPTLGTPNRSGEHANLAFALLLLRGAADETGRDDLVDLVDGAAHRLYSADRDAPVDYEPDPSDFLSPALSEAALMARVLPDVGPWLSAFLPGLGAADDPLLGVPEVSDPEDGKGAHLLGLALSRAWQLRVLAPALDAERRARVLAAADRQVASAERAIDEGSFMATHWLVSFALLAEDVAPERPLAGS